MVQVQISYNVFLNAMSIMIDGKPIPQISRLTRFQTMPFGYWCADVFRAIAEEVNDRYALTYVGRPSESHVLASYMTTCDQCSSYVNRQPEIPDTAITRLKRLSSLCQSGVKVERFSLPLHVFTDIETDQIESVLTSSLPKLAYCRILPEIKPISALAAYSDSAPAFVLTSSDVQLKSRNSPLCILRLTGREGKPQCSANCFSEAIDSDEAVGALKEYLELLYYPYVLSIAIKAAKVPENSPLYPSVTILDKMEPQTIVTLPTSVEFGETEKIKVRTIPDNSEPAKLSFRVSDESVVQVDGMGIKAVGVGEAVVEVYITGQAAKMCSGKIVAFRRNRIKKLSLKENAIEMCVGEKKTIGYTFEPSDADNKSAVKLVSSDGTVAAPDAGTTFTARRPGHCRMIVQAEKVTAETSVTVYPRLESIEIHMEREVVELESSTKTDIIRIPADATLDKLTYTVSPSSLGVYDVSSKSFYARSVGSGTLTVTNDRGTVKAVKHIDVRKRLKLSDTKKHWVLIPALIALLLLIIYFLSQ